MAFELNHDWQGNLATPRARIGERAKTRLLILLSIIWICMGLIGHEPWKSDESRSISIVNSMLQGEGLIAPVAVGESGIPHPPLYYLTASGTAWLFTPMLEMHDAARLATGLWMALTLMMVGMIGREMWGLGAGRQTNFIFLGSLGLVLTAHLLTPEVAGLAGTAMGFYALALAARRPYRAAVLLGCGLGIAFLSIGLIPALAVALTAILLPICFGEWRTKRYMIVLGLALLVAAPWLSIWPLLAWLWTPELLQDWWQNSLGRIQGANYWYFIRTLSWYALPALPLALWGLWHFRQLLRHDQRFQLSILFFIVYWLLIGTTRSTSETNALAFLIPLAAIAGGSVETLKRGAAGLLNWFGLMLFGAMAFLLWLGWAAMQFGWPAKLHERMQILSGVTEPVFGWLGLIAALFMTVIWLLVISNTRHSNRAAVTDWAVGSTMVWTLLMSLWLPWIDSAKNYAGVMRGVGTVVSDGQCLQGNGVGSAQEALLEYYTGIRLASADQACNFLMIQDERGRPKVRPSSKEWKLVWQGKRAAERREAFRLYQRVTTVSAP